MAKPIEVVASSTLVPGSVTTCDRLGVELARRLDASAVVLVVLGASRGDGMTVCIDPAGGNAEITVRPTNLAPLLRLLADRLDGVALARDGLQ